MKYKMEDMEAKQRLIEEDSEESVQLLAAKQREISGRDEEIDGLLAQVESLKHGSEINDKSVEIMKIKDDRLAWFEGISLMSISLSSLSLSRVSCLYLSMNA